MAAIQSAEIRERRVRSAGRTATANPRGEPRSGERPEAIADAPRAPDDSKEVDRATERPAEDGRRSKQEAIEQAAYFLALARGFEPGHELDDWLAAEHELDVRS